jgi:hypothetical protein
VLIGDVPYDDHGGNYEKLLRGMDKGLKLPNDMNPALKNFIESLLHPDPAMRLGAEGVEQIK